MEGILLYVSILALVYVMFISLGKTTYTMDEIVFRLMIVIISVELFIMWAFATNYIEKMPHLMRINSPLTFLLAPSFFAYVYTKLQNIKRFGIVDFLHLLPAVLTFLYLAPFYILSAQEKLEIYYQWKSGVRVDSIPIETIYRIQQFVYVLGIIGILINRWNKVNPMIFLIALAYTTIWGIDVIRYYTSQSDSIFIWIHFISFLPLLIFFELRFRQSGKKYATSGIRNSKAEPIATQAYELIVNEELYKNPKLNLTGIASRLGVHPNYVSQAINSSYGRRFNDIVNSMRVEEAKKLLADESLNYLTLEAIAEMAGFNSVSSFNAAFKKHAHMTPSAFKREVV